MSRFLAEKNECARSFAGSPAVRSAGNMKGAGMATASPSRFGLDSAVWIIIVAVLLVVVAAMAIYLK
jgi:hypothetical protein